MISTQAYKKFDLWKLPEILVVHLKRFQFSPQREKLSFFVDFPITGLDLSPYVLSKVRLARDVACFLRLRCSFGAD